jgi:dienelactone hydrolase
VTSLLRNIFGALALFSSAAIAQAQLTPASATVPLKGAGAFGGTVNMEAEVFLPTGPGPFPVMIYAHGRAVSQQERIALRDVIPRQYLDFWLSRGFAAVGVARPGYGRTGGPDRETPGHTWEGPGRCGGTFNPGRVAEVAGSAILATVDWVKQQRWAKQGSLVVSGNSVGGMTAVSVAARAPVGVVAVINFAGGVGGNPSLSPGKSCSPDTLTEFFRKLGASSRVPMLWLYAPNDLFWGADVPHAWYAAFVQGGAQASSFAMTGPTASPDGHSLIFTGRELWEPQVDSFLKNLGL